MIVGNYNYHQILFALDSFSEVDEKIGYLEKIEHDLKRVVESFKVPRTLPLKMYASKNINIGEDCDELKDFIKHQFEIISSNPYDKRYPGEGTLRGLVRAELINYQKLLTIVQDEKASIEKKQLKKSVPIEDDKQFILLEKTSPHYIAKLLNSLNNQKIIWNSSVGELIDLIKIIIILELVPGLGEDNLATFISKNFVDEKKIKYTASQIEKVYKMLQNTFWLNGRSEDPKYFQ
jgi:hypothetical protein